MLWPLLTAPTKCCHLTQFLYFVQFSRTITREEAQLIFKLRCRVTAIKNNLKGKYDTLECHACGNEEETQQHILQCKELNRIEDTEVSDYEKLFNGTVIEKLKIAKKFKENFDRLENMKK